MEEYDELTALTEYVFHNYYGLLTLEEKRIEKARISRIKASNSDGKISELLEKRWGFADDPEVNSQLADGGVKFRSRVCQRILDECSEQIVVNRCPNCARVVRTPKAKQCLWCGNDWH